MKMRFGLKHKQTGPYRWTPVEFQFDKAKIDAGKNTAINKV